MSNIELLRKILREIGSVVVAFSGGVDSSFLLKAACDTLPKENVLAVTAKSETYTSSELAQARKFTKSLGVRHRVIATNELNDNKFSSNPKNRCYYCKKELFSRLRRICKEGKFNYVIDASNMDDMSDYRPGSIAKKEFGVRSPLQEAGFTKRDIRIYSKRLRLNTWNLPQMACLASRVPYGEKITAVLLKKIEKGEAYVKRILNIKQVRLRCHKDIARIEVEAKDIKKFLNPKVCGKISAYLKRLGFCYIVLDLEGYRTGSLNKVLKNTY